MAARAARRKAARPGSRGALNAAGRRLGAGVSIGAVTLPLAIFYSYTTRRGLHSLESTTSQPRPNG